VTKAKSPTEVSGRIERMGKELLGDETSGYSDATPSNPPTT
jgi:hypothetical protein